jgi:CRP-like cAMP-binding protein
MFSKRSTETEILRSALAACPLFIGLSGTELKNLLKISHIRDFSEGEKIFEEGTIGLCYYIIVKGSVRLFSDSGGNLVILREMKEGDSFSEVHLFSETRHSVSCAAAEVTRLIVFAKPDFEGLVKMNPRLGNKVLLRFLDYFASKLEELYKENRVLKNKDYDQTD